MVQLKVVKQAIANAVLSFLAASPIIAADCRCMPGDACWPPTSSWNDLNSTVGGRLIATVPLGSPCHKPKYSKSACAVLQSEWMDPQLHMNSSSSVMAPFFANQSCDPFTPSSQPCLLGNYVDYAVNVSCPDDMIAAVKYAQRHNIRLVIRNTGHDYLGKSTGAGALAIWTHYLKDIEFLDWSDDNYDGKAIKMEAGVQGYEAMAAAHQQGLVTVSGECPTVGIAGGYTQGGGHSALSTSFGLGADQVLSWEVVTANGTLVTASLDQNPDLYWALSGGGGGTYGAVVSLTAKTYPDATVSGASLSFSAANITEDTFYQAVETFQSLLPSIIDQGIMLTYWVTNVGFQIAPLTAYGKTSEDVKAMLTNFTIALDDLRIAYKASYTQSSNYVDHFNTYLGPLPFGTYGVGNSQFGGRLIPRATFQQNNSAFTQAVRNITSDGVTFIGISMDVSSHATSANSVLPAWRSALSCAVLATPWNFTAPWSEMIKMQDKMTYSVIPQLEAVTPGSGAYMNEGDFRQPNWQEVFFGTNYEKLLDVKRKWDPENLFYAIKTVGSEAWNVAEDGRMCRA